MTSAELAYSQALDGSAAFNLNYSKFFRPEGSDALRYSQGRVTQDVTSLANGKSAQFMVLEPRGKLKRLVCLQKLTTMRL